MWYIKINYSTVTCILGRIVLQGQMVRTRNLSFKTVPCHKVTMEGVVKETGKVKGKKNKNGVIWMEVFWLWNGLHLLVGIKKTGKM